MSLYQDEMLNAEQLIADGAFRTVTSALVSRWRESPTDARLATLVPKVIALHAPAREKFTRLRDRLALDLETECSCVRWIALCAWLGDGAAVIRWLDTSALSTAFVLNAIADGQMQQILETHGGWSSLARHVDVEQIRGELEVFRDLPAREYLQTKLEPVRRALLHAGRDDDTAKLNALLDSFQSEQTAIQCSNKVS